MRVLITGVTGQDGSYLAEQLAADGHEVYGMLRGAYHPKRQWLQNLIPTIRFVSGDLLDQSSLVSALKNSTPDVVYNLGALTFVGMSWEQPAIMTEVTGLGVLRLLEAIRTCDPTIRLVHASSSEQFGSSPPPQDEKTHFRPRSPYGVAKTMAHHTVVNYRDSYGMHVSTVIMFNHTSTRRGLEFVERKITHGAARIAAGLSDSLHLGPLDRFRDWGWAPDYMQALPLVSKNDVPGDYVLATGHMNSVREVVEYAFEFHGLDWTNYVVADPSLYRPADVEALCGNTFKVRQELGWQATFAFEEIMDRLCRHDAAGALSQLDQS